MDPAGHAIEAPSPPPDGWLRPGWRLGLPWLWVLACVAIIPIVVYVVSYWPWVELGNLWFAGFPADHTGTDTFLALQQRMYDYHNNLRATHAASSPWWAWPFDFKPVWFYLGNLAEGWTALTYDAGNLVLFWLSVPAMAWTAAMAWRRRSLPLALILIGFACQWLPWARIDRATFQYHYYTSLPFVILALAYFLAELWHGPSARTWLLARLAAAGALVAVPLLWLLRVPLCAISGVAQVNPGSQACGYVSEAFVLTERMAVSLVIILVGILVLLWQARTLGLRRRRSEIEGAPEGRLPAGSLWLLVTAVTTGVAVAIVQTRFPETPLDHGADRRSRPVPRAPCCSASPWPSWPGSSSAPAIHGASSSGPSARWPSGSSSSSPTSPPCRCRPASRGCSRPCPYRPTTTTSSSRSTPPARRRRAW